MLYTFNVSLNMPDGWENLAAADAAKAAAQSLLVSLHLLTAGYQGSAFREVGPDANHGLLLPLDVAIAVPGGSSLPTPAATLQGTDGVKLSWVGTATNRAVGAMIPSSSSSNVSWYVNDNGTVTTTDHGFTPQMITDVLQSGWLDNNGALPARTRATLTGDTGTEVPG